MQFEVATQRSHSLLTPSLDSLGGPSVLSRSLYNCVAEGD